MNNTQLELLDGYLDNAFDTIYEDNRIDERDFKIDRLKKLMTIYYTPHYDYQLFGVKSDVKSSFKVLHDLYHNSLLSYDDSFIRRNVRALDHYFKGTGNINKVRLQQEMAKKIHEFITELESGWRLDLIAYLGRNEALQQNKIYLARQDKLIKYKLLNKNGKLIIGSIIDTYSNFAMPNANKDWEGSEFRAIRKTIKEPILAILPKSSIEDSDGKTALHRAAEEGKEEIVKILLSKGADINAKDSNGETALHWAAWLGYTEVVNKLLLTNKADINIKNKKGFTALGLAKLNSSEGVIKSIYEHQIRSVPYYFSEFAKSFFTSDIRELCVNPSLACTTVIRRRQPIHVAARYGNKQVLNFLIEKGADINAKDSDGCTALHHG